MRTCLIVGVALASALLLAGDSWGQAKEAVKKARPLIVLNGGDSQVKHESFRRLSSEKEWDETWAEHLGTTTDDYYRTGFDFDSQNLMVVAVFLGETINVTGIEVSEILESPNTITIRTIDRGYQTMVQEGEEFPPPDRPYAFILLPRSTKEVVIEEGLLREKGGPPEWKLRARLPRIRSNSPE
jgi:hypothetical protein